MAASEFEGGTTIEGFTTTWRSVVTDPRAFFAAMPETGGLQAPLTFLAICALANGVGHLLLGWGLRTLIAVVIGQIVTAFVLAALLVLVAQNLFAGRAGFESTFRVVAYASAASVFEWLPKRLGVLAGLYAAYLIVLGLERVHGFDATHAVLTVLICVAVVLMLGAAWPILPP